MGGGELAWPDLKETSFSECVIDPSWIIEGAPVARVQLLFRSVDSAGSTYLWDCTAGAFHWRFNSDESIYLLEGAVVVRDAAGNERRLAAGDHAFFRKGTRWVWRVETYVRKVAFCHNPLPRPLIIAKRVARRLLETMGLRPREAGGLA
jgi:uncharacterized cupin superfamily protein